MCGVRSNTPTHPSHSLGHVLTQFALSLTLTLTFSHLHTFAGTVHQSDFHKAGLPTAAQAKAVVVPNGLDSLYSPPTPLPSSSSSSGGSPSDAAGASTATSAVATATAAASTGTGADDDRCPNAREAKGSTSLVFAYGSNPTRGLLGEWSVSHVPSYAPPNSAPHIYTYRRVGGMARHP